MENEAEVVRLAVGRQHIDLLKRVVALEASSGMETVVLEADPHRYEWQEIDGRWLLVDRFEPDQLPAEAFFALIGRIIRQPFYHEITETTVEGIKKKSLRIYVTRQRPASG